MNQMPTEKVTIHNSGAIIDRTFADSLEDAEVSVELPCGHRERFWLTSLSDAEYIKRARHLKRLDHRGDE